MDMLQRAPIEVLTADERLSAIHDQEFGVNDAAARELCVGQYA